LQYTLSMPLRPLVIACLLLAAAPACSDADDDIRANVTVLCNHEGMMATAAAERLERYGRRAIPTIEAAMHTANPVGRKNLILALRRIGDGEAVPLLAHIAVYDGSPDVRREAVWTLKGWAADDKKPERAAKAKAALRAADETRHAEEAG
jgi:HEAT repeats